MMVVQVPIAQAQDKPIGYPVRPLRIIISVAPGAGADIVARASAAVLTEKWGQNVVVDPRPGGGGLIASKALLRSTPDGYTILQAGDGIMYQRLTRGAPFEALKEFEPVVSTSTQPYMLLAHPGVAAKNIQELVALSAARPLLYAGSSGVGGTVHLGMEKLGQLSGMKLKHVSYKGGTPTMLALIGGEINLACVNVLTAMPFIKSGKARGIVTFGPKRSSVLPELPTAIEQGLPASFRITNRYSLWVRGGTPRPIINTINRTIADAFRTPQMVQRLATDGSEPADYMSPAELKADFARLLAEFEKQVKELGLKF
jgi:tripartite-type tricarboxylate transporter receptor subunit TctC